MKDKGLKTNLTIHEIQMLEAYRALPADSDRVRVLVTARHCVHAAFRKRMSSWIKTVSCGLGFPRHELRLIAVVRQIMWQRDLEALYVSLGILSREDLIERANERLASFSDYGLARAVDELRDRGPAKRENSCEPAGA